jgi:2,4-dienoyl-CoA reductase-like NADH-dependent reductase (Old Yellow Enzyme family)
MRDDDEHLRAALFRPLELPCGAVLKNRIAKSAMSDSLGDGRGDPTDTQIRLYRRWAEGGVAVAIVGEVQGDPRAAEKPGNLVLRPESDRARFEALAGAGAANGARLWLQLGQAGAMTHPPIGQPKGPSALELPGLTCAALTLAEVQALPAEFARTAALAKSLGFGGVQVHAAHGFLLSQFLSPLFNRRDDAYGGGIAGRMRLVLEVVEAVRAAVGPDFPVALKLNATDQLEGGLAEDEALEVVAALDGLGLDLLDISGGTYFPGAKSASDGAGKGPYFLDFAKRARERTAMPLMATGGFKTLQQAGEAVAEGHVDMVGLARALALDPALPKGWRDGTKGDPAFPRFAAPPEGGVTAWYTMRLAELGEDREAEPAPDLEAAMRAYLERDAARVPLWNARFRTR